MRTRPIDMQRRSDGAAGRTAAQPNRRRAELVLICAAFAAIVTCLVLVATVSMEILSAARGYTQGEALWSKGQKDAVLNLLRYAHTRSEDDYQRFLAAIHIPLACRAARHQMDLPRYDPATLASAFREAGINQEDRSRMVWFYRHFGSERHLAKAIAIWVEADGDILALERNGQELHQRILSGTLDQRLLDETTAENVRINRNLTPIEARFSQSLAEASRWLHKLLTTMLSLLGALLIAAGSAVFHRLVGRVANSEQKYRHLLDTASVAILIADGRTGRIVDANRQAVDTLGPAALDRAQSVQPLLCLTSSDSDICDFSGLVGAKRETRLHLANGTSLDVEVSGSLVHVHRKPLIELIVRDVTAHKQAAALIRESEQRYRQLSDELRIARDRALDASRVKSQFLANMSHEIRTPMNGVMGMLDLALDRCSDQEQREHLEAALRAAEALLSILNDILDLSRIEAGKMNVEAIDFDLRDTVEQALRIFQTAVRQKNIRLELSFTPDCPTWVRGDPVRVRQVLINLAGNAVKFTERGRVEVRVSGCAEGIRLEVQDTGIGIPASQLGAIFEPFTQADGSQTRKFGGSGLGLTITRRLVELMGGRVWAESAPDSGSCFLVELPFPSRPPAVRNTRASAAHPEPQLAQLNILVAEDSPINQKVICGLLSRQGSTVTLAANGKEVWQRFSEGRYDVVLMDVQMPELDGFEATRLIRETERSAGACSHTPILAVTAHASRQQHDQCLAAGMDGVITKPVNAAELVEAIGSVLASKTPARV